MLRASLMTWLRRDASSTSLRGQSTAPSRSILDAQEILGGMGLDPEEIKKVRSEFDANHYAFTYPDVTKTGADLLSHYLMFGSSEGRWPTADFNPSAYLLLHGDVADAGLEPFVHFVMSGRGEGRRTNIEPSGVKKVPTQPQDSLDTASHPWPNFVTTFAGLDLVEVAEELDLGLQSVSPSVSIVIPLHNRPELLLECLASIARAADGLPFEVVVVDDDSEPDTKEVVSGLRDVKVVTTKSNVGYPAACNLGIAEAEGEFVALVNSDVQLAPRCLALLVEAAREHQDSHGIFGPVLLNLDGSIQECGGSLGIAGRTVMNGYALQQGTTPLDQGGWTVDYVSGAVLLMSRALLNSMSGLDETFRSGYFEDSSLAQGVLRRHGLKTMVVGGARAVHHLSASMDLRGKNFKILQSDANRISFLRTWGDRCFRPVQNVAFYLPQFHAIPENDEWWGEGFTEWTNVASAQPVYHGHVQPRVPTVLGHYSLTDASVLDRQFRLASAFGIQAFCFYYYSFGGKNPLRRPLDLLVDTPEIPARFCLCWANEPWSRRWDGGSGEVLLDQSMSDDEVLQAAEGMVRYLADERYIRVDGKPLVLLYRVQLAANPLRTTAIMRNTFKKFGIGEVLIACVESFEFATSPQDPRDFGCDISVEFPPHGMGVPLNDGRVSVIQGKAPQLFDYASMIEQWRRKQEVPWLRYPGVTPRWDNTPRQLLNPTVLIGSNPKLFRTWLADAHKRAASQNPPEHRMVFINAWNEWGEGAYMEPDQEWGYGYLEAVRSVRDVRLAEYDG